VINMFRWLFYILVPTNSSVNKTITFRRTTYQNEVKVKRQPDKTTITVTSRTATISLSKQKEQQLLCLIYNSLTQQ
jgi:hypothetical protein